MKVEVIRNEHTDVSFTFETAGSKLGYKQI